MMIAITEVLLLIEEIIEGTTGDEWIERIEQRARIAAITGVSNFYNTSKYFVIFVPYTVTYEVNSVLSRRKLYPVTISILIEFNESPTKFASSN